MASKNSSFGFKGRLEKAKKALKSTRKHVYEDIHDYKHEIKKDKSLLKKLKRG